MYRKFPLFTRRELMIALAAALLVIFLANLPVLIGYLQTGSEVVYTGATVFAGDYYTYLAKINQGQAGSWVYRLAFTSQDHPGAPLFLYYLFLGNFSRWLGLSTPLMFHAARLLNSLLFLGVLYYFIAFWTARASERRFLFLLTALSSGIGWLVMMGGQVTSTDLIVPESNVLFSMMSTAHFTLSQAVMLAFFILMLLQPSTLIWRRAGQFVLLALSAALLMILQPFMAAVILPVGGIFLLAQWRIHHVFPWPTFWRMVLATAVCIGLAIWIYLLVQTDPFLANWQAQNETLSPPVWDFLSGYGLVLLAALVGMAWAVRQKDAALWLLVAWVVVTAVGLYSPTVLQRRLSLGLHIPVAVLGGLAVLNVWAPRWKEKNRKRNLYAFLAVTAITSFLLVLINIVGVVAHDPQVFLTRDEADALHYLDSHSQAGEMALASDEFNAFIPAFTHLRAVSGHKFETVDYEQTKLLVNSFFSGGMNDDEMEGQLNTWRVSYIISGVTGETAAYTLPSGINFELFHTVGNVKIYRRIK